MKETCTSASDDAMASSVCVCAHGWALDQVRKKKNLRPYTCVFMREVSMYVPKVNRQFSTLWGIFFGKHVLARARLRKRKYNQRKMMKKKKEKKKSDFIAELNSEFFFLFSLIFNLFF